MSGRQQITVVVRSDLTSDHGIDSLVSDCFDINPGFGSPNAEAWRADILRLAAP